MNSLWYKSPAEDEGTAFPVGNGRIGALVYGRLDHEIIVLNEESVWSSSYVNRNNSENKKKPSLRNSCGSPFYQTFYQSAGTFCMDFYNPQQEQAFSFPSDYNRRLDFETGLASVSFSKEYSMPSTADFSSNTRASSVTYTREVFASAFSDVLVIHISASIPKSLYLNAYFDRGPFMSRAYNLSDDTIVMQDTHGIPFAALATAISFGGSVSATSSGLTIEAADEVTIFIDIQTAYRKGHYFRKNGNVHKNLSSLASLCSDLALKNICFASASPYTEVYENHVAEYREKFFASTLSLLDENEKDERLLPTDTFFTKKTKTPAFWELYWKFCHYLYISSCTRRASLPISERGLWSSDMMESGRGRFSLSPDAIWFLSFGGRIEKWLLKVCRQGRETARLMYGLEGLAAHNSLDIWGDTVFNGSINDAEDEEIKPIGFSYLVLLVRQVYDYTKDLKFLKKFYNAMMVGTASFLLNYRGEVSEDDSALISAAMGAIFQSAKDLKINPPFSYSGLNTFATFTFLQKPLSDSPDFCASALKERLSDYTAMNSFLVKSSIFYEDESEIVKIHLLESLPLAWQTGSASGIHIKGNLFLDLKWKDKKLTAGKLYTKEGSAFTKTVEIIYQEKSYRAPLHEGCLDIFNVLPSTLK